MNPQRSAENSELSPDAIEQVARLASRLVLAGLRLGSSAPAEDPMLTLAEVMTATGLGKTTIYNAVNDGRLHRPFKPSARVTRWRRSWVDDFIAKHIVVRDAA